MAVSKNLFILFGIVFTLLLFISSHEVVASRENFGKTKVVIDGNNGLVKDKSFCDSKGSYEQCNTKNPKIPKKRRCTKYTCRDYPPTSP